MSELKASMWRYAPNAREEQERPVRLGLAEEDSLFSGELQTRFKAPCVDPAR